VGIDLSPKVLAIARKMRPPPMRFTLRGKCWREMATSKKFTVVTITVAEPTAMARK
jgi:hypothetical protein